MKRALTVGINYPGTSNELRGCVNDSLKIQKLLREQYGFEDITVLLDEQATTENMRRELNKLVANAKRGDVLFFHYSGHGSQVFNQQNDDDHEPDGLDEILCPVDVDWDKKILRDDELREIFDKVPNGVNLTVFLDCCNSGGGLDHNNQYQPLAPGERVFESGSSQPGRYIPPPQAIQEKAATFNSIHVEPRTLSRKEDHTGLLISGCQSNQTAADAFIDGIYQGATTYYLCNTIAKLGTQATYRQLIERINKDIAAAGYTQRPELNGPESLFDQWFLGDHTNIDFDAPKPKKKKKSNIFDKIIEFFKKLFG